MKRTMRAIADELVGLFVDDGLLALSLLIWCAIVAIMMAAAPAIGALGGGLMMVGGAIGGLLFSVWRGARGTARARLGIGAVPVRVGATASARIAADRGGARDGGASG